MTKIVVRNRGSWKVEASSRVSILLWRDPFLRLKQDCHNPTGTTNIKGVDTMNSLSDLPIEAKDTDATNVIHPMMFNACM